MYLKCLKSVTVSAMKVLFGASFYKPSLQRIVCSKITLKCTITVVHEEHVHIIQLISHDFMIITYRCDQLTFFYYHMLIMAINNRLWVSVNRPIILQISMLAKLINICHYQLFNNISTAVKFFQPYIYIISSVNNYNFTAVPFGTYIVIRNNTTIKQVEQQPYMCINMASHSVGLTNFSFISK